MSVVAAARIRVIHKGVHCELIQVYTARLYCMSHVCVCLCVSFIHVIVGVMIAQGEKLMQSQSQKLVSAAI